MEQEAKNIFRFLINLKLFGTIFGWNYEISFSFHLNFDSMTDIERENYQNKMDELNYQNYDC